MKTYSNISATSRAKMAVAKANRHSRYAPGCDVSYKLTITVLGQRPEGNWAQPEVSR